MSNTLEASLSEFKDSLTTEEIGCYKLLLSLASGAIAPDFIINHSSDAEEKLKVIKKSLLDISRVKDKISDKEIAWIGRPSFMTEELLQSLIDESVQLRENAVECNGHFLGTGAPLANQLAMSAELTSFVQQYAGNATPTGVASFLYYDIEGQGIPPHVDTNVFSLNVILMLRHENIDNIDEHNLSHLVVFPNNEEIKRIRLQAGEMVILFAGNVIHAREKVHKNEVVSILTFGFQPY